MRKFIFVIIQPRTKMHLKSHSKIFYFYSIMFRICIYEREADSFLSVEPDLIATEMLAFPSKSSRNKMIVI